MGQFQQLLSQRGWAGPQGTVHQVGSARDPGVARTLAPGEEQNQHMVFFLPGCLLLPLSQARGHGRPWHPSEARDGFPTRSMQRGPLDGRRTITNRLQTGLEEGGEGISQLGKHPQETLFRGKSHGS